MKTAESVSPMHPDKICDRISDAILDECLKQDENSRVAVETMGGHGIITITGEVTSNAHVNYRDVAKSIVGDKYGIQVNIVEQSREIGSGVDSGGAGDQGIMIGYACNETPELMPREVVLARDLNRQIFAKFPFDGKTQVTIDKDGAIDNVVASFQNVPYDKLYAMVITWLVHKKVSNNIITRINPAGDWSVGGFEADTGLTGRKLAVDNYGPSIPLGGGCFSGKDATKVDRSAAYMARRVAVDWVSSHEHCEQALVRLAYAIGYDKPLEATIIWNEWGCLPLVSSIPENQYDLTPNGIIKFLDLRRPIYSKTAEYGHFGNGFAWDGE